MTEKEIDIIDSKIEEVWGDWELVLKVMSENNLKILGDEILTSDGNCVCSICDYNCISEETVELFRLAYELYKKVNSSSNTHSGRCKYMKLC